MNGQTVAVISAPPLPLRNGTSGTGAGTGVIACPPAAAAAP